MVGDEKKAEWAKHWITLGFEGLPYFHYIADSL